MNCVDCPEMELYAVRDPDDWFGVEADVHCRLADGRIVRKHSDICPTTVESPEWCPRRKRRK